MVSFISVNFLSEEPCCKFILEHDIKNYSRQVTKTLIICFQCNTTGTDLVICSCVWLGQINGCAKYGILSDKNIHCIG